MKKIDFHVHTLATCWDSPFVFSLENLRRYVSNTGLDAIAVTNHNLFDGSQFRTIKESLNAPVFPGIEIHVEMGHILVIADGSDLEDFEAKTDSISREIPQVGGSIAVEKLEKIFGNLGEYLIIPHYDKDPSIRGETLERIRRYVSAGEVDSAKKFIRALKDGSKLTPALFSDVRISEDLATLPTRQTYMDCGEVSLDAFKICLKDKRKVALSEADGNRLFQVLENGQKLSTGLNVLIGDRSSGKTYTLNRINEANRNVKYIHQFSLVQQDEDACERDFKNDVQRKRSCFIEGYLSGFKAVLDDVIDIDLNSNNRAIEQYITSLLKTAEDAERRDAYSQMALFSEVEYPISQSRVLQELIESVRHVIENVEYRSVVEKYLDVTSLKNLACELIDLLWGKALEIKRKRLVNSLVKDIKESLRMRTSAVQVADVDFYGARMDEERIRKFTDIVRFLRKEAVISEENVQGFRVEARKGSFAGAGEIKDASGVVTTFKEAFKQYEHPYKYLQALKSNQSLTPSELYRLFAKINYRILNKDGAEVSGGERSEFRLLQEIKDAQNHDMLLIDEPESSFDNMFLKSDVDQLIRDISKSMPVVVVTHNSTVGASIGADYLLYASKEREGGNLVYRLYSGRPTDKKLFSTDGKTKGNHEVVMNSLEAGQDTYDDRRRIYEATKD